MGRALRAIKLKHMVVALIAVMTTIYVYCNTGIGLWNFILILPKISNILFLSDVQPVTRNHIKNNNVSHTVSSIWNRLEFFSKINFMKTVFFLNLENILFPT